MARLTSLWSVLLAAATSATAGVQQDDLSAFFSSSQGLAMPSQAAAALANQEAKSLTACGVTVPMLQALRDTMSSMSMLNMGIAEVRQNLLPLAYQHVSPAALNQLFQVLNWGKMNLFRGDAVAKALQLGVQKAEPNLLSPLYEVLFWDIDLPRPEAEQTAVDLASAGADPSRLKASYLEARRRMSKDAALKAAISDAVAANLYGLEARYAKDGRPYVAKEFQTYYGAQWFAEWLAAPREKRTAQDGKDYLAAEFLAYYGPAWNAKWAASATSEQRRLAPADGKTYTLEEFARYYSDSWQREWARSYEVLDTCAGLDHASCDAQWTRCRWSWTGDWTTSCVVKALESKPSLEL